jgi:outer membrane porin, OprD family
MKWPLLILSLCAETALASAQSESGGLVEDSALTLNFLNAYFHRDFKDKAPDQSRWAQAITSSFESGFTQGRVGFGLDAYTLTAIKLDTGKSRNDGDITFLPTDRRGRTEEHISEAGAALKARFSNTVLKYGNQLPALPVLAYDDSRLLPQTFTGMLLTSEEIEGLVVHAGRFTAQSDMQQTGRDSAKLKAINLLGATYHASEDLEGAFYLSHIQDVAQKYYANLTYTLHLNDEHNAEALDQALTFDFDIYQTNYKKRYTETGKKEDNTFWSLSVAYAIGAHTFTVAHQRSHGGFENLDEDGNLVAHGYDFDIGDGGNANYVANAYYSDFNAKDERSWQLAYGLDFSAFGIPGLELTAAYVYGNNIDTGANSHASERELYKQLQYTVQEGAAKDLSVSISHSSYRASRRYGPGLEEVQVFIGYPLEVF